MIKLASSAAALFIALGLGRLLYNERSIRPSIVALSVGLGIGLNFILLEKQYLTGAIVSILGLLASISLKNESNKESQK